MSCPFFLHPSYALFNQRPSLLVNSNTAESFFALLKRGMYGTFHHCGKQHLQRYVDEFAFRWDWRKATDHARTEAALKAAPGKRLSYKPLQ